MDSSKTRGSEKLMAAWRARALTEEGVAEIARALDDSPANVDTAAFSGGAEASGLRLGLTYTGDDVPWCGNDILFWLNWHRKYGGAVKPPKILIDGRPFPDLLRLEFDFGQVAENLEPGLEGFDIDVGGLRGGQ